MKFSTMDNNYLTRRKKISEKSGARELWSVIDQWPLYCGIANLGRFMAISDLLRETLDVPGHVVEFGSWKGANLMFLAKLLKLYDPFGCKLTYCFDSFVGLETFAAQDGNAEKVEGGKYRGDYEELAEFISLYELGDDIVIHKGDILDTLPKVLEDESLNFSFVYCDTDLYAPSRSILDNLHGRLSKGGLIVMDEWNYQKWPGESVAVREFMDTHGDSYRMRHVRGARQPSLVLEKVI